VIRRWTDEREEWARSGVHQPSSRSSALSRSMLVQPHSSSDCRLGSFCAVAIGAFRSVKKINVITRSCLLTHSSPSRHWRSILNLACSPSFSAASSSPSTADSYSSPSPSSTRLVTATRSQRTSASVASSARPTPALYAGSTPYSSYPLRLPNNRAVKLEWSVSQPSRLQWWRQRLHTKETTSRPPWSSHLFFTPRRPPSRPRAEKRGHGADGVGE